jgi:hypothetical protein
MSQHTMRENFWWILAVVALAATLLFGPGGRSQKTPGLPRMQDSGPTDPSSWRPRPPFQY